jgi:hypothetical protein
LNHEVERSSDSPADIVRNHFRAKDVDGARLACVVCEGRTGPRE